jgi:hypothetical protein
VPLRVLCGKNNKFTTENAEKHREKKTRTISHIQTKKQTDNDTQNPSIQRLSDTVARMPAADSMLPHLAVIPILLTFDRDKLCKIEAEGSYQTFVQVDNEVLRYR